MNINRKLPIFIFFGIVGLFFIASSGCVDMDEMRREAAKEIAHPEIELKSVPMEPKRGDEVTIFTKPLYFNNPTDELYYTWAIDTGQSQQAIPPLPPQPLAVSFQPLVAGNDEFIFIPDAGDPDKGGMSGLPHTPGLKNDYGIFYTVSGDPTSVAISTSEFVYRPPSGEADTCVVGRAPFVDEDNDGMDDNWERKYFPDIENIVDIKPDEDSDDDGYFADSFKTSSWTWNKITATSETKGECGEKSLDWGGWKGGSSYNNYKRGLAGWICYQATAKVEGGGGGTGGSGGSDPSDPSDPDWWGEGGEGGEGGEAEIDLPPECQPYPCLDGVSGTNDGHIYLLDESGNDLIVDCGQVDLVTLDAGTYTIKACLTDNESSAYEIVASFGYPTFSTSMGRADAPDAGDNDPETDLDTTGDGRFTNLEEYIFGTDPTNQDTDADGYNDERDVVGLGQDEMEFTIPKDLPESVEWYRIYNLVVGISQKYKILEREDQSYVASSSGNEKFSLSDEGEHFKVFIVSEEEEETKRKLEVELSAEELFPSVGTPVEVLATPLYSGLDYNHLWYKWELTFRNSEGEFVGITDQATGLDPPDGNIFQEGKRAFTFTPAVSGIFRVRAFVKERQEEEYELKMATDQLIIEAGSKIKLQFNSGEQPPNLITDDILKITAQPLFECTKENVDNKASYCAYVWYLDGERQRSTSGSPQEFRLMVAKPGGSKYKLKVTVANVDGSETATEEVELFVYSPEATIIPAPDTRIPTKPFVIAEVKTGDLITFEASPGPANSTFANDSLYYTWSIDKAEVFSEDFFRMDIMAGLSENRKTLTLSVERKKGSRYLIGLTADASGVSLAADASSGQRQIEVRDSSVFSIRQSAIIYDYKRSEKVIIADILTETSIVLANELNYSYQVSDKAKVRQSSTGRRAVDSIILEVVETPCKEVGSSCSADEECCSKYCEEGICRPILTTSFFGSMFGAIGFFLPESFKLALKIGLGGLGILILIAVIFSVMSSSNFLGPKKKQ